MRAPADSRPVVLRRERAALFALALAVRLVWNLALHPPATFIFSDMRGYETSASNLLAGVASPASTFTPLGYPAFLAAIYAVTSHSFVAVAVVQAVLGAASCLLGLRLAERVLGSRRLALVVGGALALYVPHVFYGGFLLTETLATFLGTAVVALLVDAESSGAPVRGRLLAGAALGALTLVRPNAVLAYPFVLAFSWLATQRDARLAARHAAPVLGVALVFVAFASARNSLLLGRPAGIATNGGLNFFLAHTEFRGASFSDGHAQSSIVPIRNGHRYASSPMWISTVPLHDEATFYGLGLRAILARPSELLRALDNVREGLGGGHQIYWPDWPSVRVVSITLTFFARAFFSLVFIPAAIHAARLVSRRGAWTAEGAPRILLVGFALSSLVTMYLFLGDPRVRVPFDVCFVVLAVEAASLARSWLRS